jgi:hypothetical protein
MFSMNVRTSPELAYGSKHVGQYYSLDGAVLHI